MKVPGDVRTDLRKKVGKLADAAGWTGLPAADRSRLYHEWANDPAIGGVLARYLNVSQIRTYIKDTIIKPYARAKLGGPDGVLRLVEVDRTAAIHERYTRPPGVRLDDGRVVCWGRAEDWKQLLMATFERAYAHRSAKSDSVILLNAVGRFEQDDFRGLVEAAAKLLGISQLVWRTEVSWTR